MEKASGLSKFKTYSSVDESPLPESPPPELLAPLEPPPPDAAGVPPPEGPLPPPVGPPPSDGAPAAPVLGEDVIATTLGIACVAHVIIFLPDFANSFILFSIFLRALNFALS